ncbi:MAG: carboxynorspermidine decarboxylase, partial [Bacteroidales bacterium]|nr:carboxynorspermidine decarboxylase [Bacteroidales bacterium]
MKFSELTTPSYIVQEGALIKNLSVLKRVQDEAGCKILLAEKAFSMFRVYPLIADYLAGTTASGLYEARLAFEEFKSESNPHPENHVFEPAYSSGEMKDLSGICTHIYFNSLSQLDAHRPIWEPAVKAGKMKTALRINPEFSTQEGHAIYDPCGPGSRLGIRRSRMPEKLPEGVSGLHFHTLCEQGVEPLIETFRSIEENFGSYLKQASWINMGGGHHITRKDYDVERLIGFVKEVKEKWKLEVYLEPGEAIALNAGTLIAKVLDIVETSDLPTLILDASAACHMPDVLEMPYTPPLFGALLSRGAAEPPEGGEAAGGVWLRLASRTCLAGDVIGLYCLPEMPKIGDILTFGDMAIYSMVKN